MFIAVTAISAPPEQLDTIAQGFRRSAADLKQFKGFLGLELWRDGSSLQAVSRWETRADMEVYQRSDAFRAHHGGAEGAHGHGDAAAARPHAAHGGSGSTAEYDAEVLA